MRKIFHRCTLVAATALAASLMAFLPNVAQASGDTLTMTTSYATDGTISVILTGTASSVSSLYVYSQPLSSGDCLPTPHDEFLAGADFHLNEGLVAYALPAGAFSKSVPVSNPGTSKTVICGYLSPEPQSPSGPGSMMATPVATAEAQVGGAEACSDLDKTFTVSKVTALTRWQAISLFKGRTAGNATIAVTAGSPGYVALTGPSAEDTPTQLTDGQASSAVEDGRVTPGSSATYRLVFYPLASDAGGDVVDSCTQGDGTPVTLGPGSAVHGPAQTLVLTWFPAGQGGSASVNGAVVPGSSPKLPAANHKATVTGTPKVGKTLTCSGVKVPAGDKQAFYAWSVNGRLVSTSHFYKTTTVRSAWRGKSLSCAVGDESLAGWPAVWSDPVTVRHG